MLCDEKTYGYKSKETVPFWHICRMQYKFWIAQPAQVSFLNEYRQLG